MPRAARAIAAAVSIATAATPAPHASAAEAAPLPAIQAALADLHGADLVVIAPAGVLVALRARAPADRVRAILRDPPRYRDAVPALARADVTGRRRAPRSTVESTVEGTVEILDLEWELEIPLFTLKGRA